MCGPPSVTPVECVSSTRSYAIVIDTELRHRDEEKLADTALPFLALIQRAGAEPARPNSTEPPDGNQR
jgi:hypothetical protein